jgi:hypothetical protein
MLGKTVGAEHRINPTLVRATVGYGVWEVYVPDNVDREIANEDGHRHQEEFRKHQMKSCYQGTEDHCLNNFLFIF